MKTFIYFFILSFFANGLNSQWIDEKFESKDNYFCSFFLDMNKGWISGGDNYKGYIYKTIDGGKNWKKTNFSDTYELESIFFINENKGWAVGDSGIVITTSNGGENWFFQNSGTKSYLSSVFFVNEDIGWICYGYLVGFPSSKAYGVIMHTVDGGENWFIQTEIENYRFKDIYFHDNKTGWAVGDNHQSKTEIYKTNDGGNSWKPVSINTIWKSFSSIRFIDNLTGWIVGESGIILKTNDGGNSWEPQTGGYKNYNLYSCFVVDKNTAYVAGQKGYILYTSNGGETWGEQERVTSKTLNSICFTDKNRGWAVGFGIVLSTENGGITSVEEIDMPYSNSLKQNNPNPFSTTTTIDYSILESGFTSLIVFDALGNKIATLVNETQPPGNYEINYDAKNLPGGTYYYQIKAGRFSDSKKFMVLK